MAVTGHDRVALKSLDTSFFLVNGSRRLFWAQKSWFIHTKKFRASLAAGKGCSLDKASVRVESFPRNVRVLVV